MSTRKVYVLETDCYENRGVHGVYDSPERAMAAWKGVWTRSTYTDEDGAQRVSWNNDLDWSDAASVYEYDLTDVGPEKAPDRAVVQVYQPLNGGWAYVPESPESLALARDAAVVMRRHRERSHWSEPEPTDVDRRIAALAAPPRKERPE